MQDDHQLKYLIQLCRAKNIPEEEILKILEENSKSDFIVSLEKSWKNSEEYTRVPQKWQEYSVKYIEYIGSLMDPTKCYSTLPVEPNWPNPQVKKKTEAKLKRDFTLFVLQEKNKCLKKSSKDSDLADLFTVVTAVNSAYNTPNTENKSVKQELDSWNNGDSEEEFSSKGPVLVDLDVKKRDLEKNSSLESPAKKMKMSESDISVVENIAKEVDAPTEETDKVQQENIQGEKGEEVDLQSLREKVLMSRKNAKKQEQIVEQIRTDTMPVKEENENIDDISLEEGEISSDHAEDEAKEELQADMEEKDAKSFANNNGNRFGDSKVRRYENRFRKDDRRDRNANQTSGTVEKHRAVATVNPAMASYLNYPTGGNFNQSNNYMGAMHMFRPPVFALGYNQQYQPPNPYMQIDSNALAKAQMLASMSQQQSQPMFPQMPGARSGGPAMNRPPMQYSNPNQTNFWMMNMAHMNNGPGFAFAPGNVPPNNFYPFAARPSDTSHLDTNYMYENPNSRP